VVEKWEFRLGGVNIGGLKVEGLQVRHPRIKFGRAVIRVIGLVEEQILTEEEHLEANVINGVVKSDPSKDILKVCVVERHGARVGSAWALSEALGLRVGQ